MFTGILYGIVIGLLLGVIIYFFIKSKMGTATKKETTTHVQVITDKIEKVFKIVVAEGFFSEIIDFSHKDTQLWGLISSTKKSLILAKAKVLVGFDCKEVAFEVDTISKKITFTKIPNPQILAIEPDYTFYDIENGWFNKFNDADYTKLLQHAKEQIASKAFEGELLHTAKKQMQLMLSGIADTTGFNINMPKVGILSS